MAPGETHVGARADRPQVVEAITRMNIGGPGRHVLGVMEGLADRFDLVLATGEAPAVEGALVLGPVDVEQLPMVRAIAPHLDALSVVRMRSLLQRRRADLVHSHMAKAGLVARVAASALRSPPATVHTFHGHVLSGYFAPRTERFFAQVERTLARRTDLLLTVSSEVRDQLLDLRIGTPSKYEVLPLGVDLSPLLALEPGSGQLRRRLGLDRSVPLIAVPARLAPIKDHRTLLHAMVHVPQAHLAVLGDGELMAELVALAGTLGLGSRVHFTGWWTDMPSAFADIDLVVLTSRNEGTPLSLIEAGAAGLATVATGVGGVPEVVVDGRTGLLLPAGDVTGLADALRALLHDVPARNALGANARAHVQERFGLERSLQHLASIYESLIGARRRLR